jgi:hypothetical protein
MSIWRSCRGRSSCARALVVRKNVSLKVTCGRNGLPVNVELGQIDPIFWSCDQVNELSHFCLIRNLHPRVTPGVTRARDRGI